MKIDEQKKLENQSCLEINLNALNYNKELAKYFKGAKLTQGHPQGGNARENKII